MSGLIMNPPSFAGEEFHVTAQAGGTKGGGSADYGVNGVGNIVLMDNRIAMRVIGFESHDAGYVTRTFPANGASGASADVTSVGNQGAIESYGGSFSLLFELSDSLEATARILAQPYRGPGTSGVLRAVSALRAGFLHARSTSEHTRVRT